MSATSIIVDSNTLPWENGLDYLKTLTPAFRDNLGPADQVEHNFAKPQHKEILMFKLIAVGIFCFMSMFAHAQTKPTDMLMYEYSGDVKSSGQGFVWGGFQLRQGAMKVNRNGHQVYLLGGAVDVFDPESFAVGADASENFSLNPKNNKAVSLEKGGTWDTRFNFPSLPGSQCMQDSAWKVTNLSEGPTDVAVVINGAVSTLMGVKVVSKGWWSACGHSGETHQIAIYSTDKKILLSHEWVGFSMGQIRAGRKIVLKEIRTN